MRTLFITGYAPTDDLERATLTEACAVLRKPFSASELLNKVREMLDEEMAETERP